MTDFENAAFALFIVLLSRAILSFSLTFYIPISKVSGVIQQRDACLERVARLMKTCKGHN